MDKDTWLELFGAPDLVEVLALGNACLTCANEGDYHQLIHSFSAFLGFEFCLCAHMGSSYEKTRQVQFTNLSNPPEWMREYEAEGYLEHDPVRIELERRLAGAEFAQELCQTILWDAYERPLSPMETRVIERRRHFGLHYGFSVFCNSMRHDAILLVSFASATRKPDWKSREAALLVAPHLNRCRKRLDILSRLDALTRQEHVVAAWLVEGKTNWEIAQLVGLTESTVKFHIANIFSKLRVTNRQNAVSILIAGRYLS